MKYHSTVVAVTVICNILFWGFVIFVVGAMVNSCVGADTYTVTAYCACSKCCGKHADGITASGKPVVQGTTVAGPRRLPFGTRVYIKGVGWRTVQDRLARRYDSRFDVYFQDHKEALQFGIRRLKVWVKGNTKKHNASRTQRQRVLVGQDDAA